MKNYILFIMWSIIQRNSLFEELIMKRLSIMLCCLCFPYLLKAADNPEDVNNVVRYDKQSCVQSRADMCVNQMCTAGPGSSDINCPDKCQETAKDECEVSSN